MFFLRAALCKKNVRMWWQSVGVLIKSQSFHETFLLDYKLDKCLSVFPSLKWNRMSKVDWSWPPPFFYLKSWVSSGWVFPLPQVG
jgi:hypothetical protein